jgi:hypothetical protein
MIDIHRNGLSNCRLLLAALLLAPFLPACAQESEGEAAPPASPWGTIKSAVSFSGGVELIPLDNWASGDFNALTDGWFGEATPDDNNTSLSMDRTWSTTYEGNFLFTKLKLNVGIDLNVDNNVIGKIYGLMGYIGYYGFMLRAQTSELRGTLSWTGQSVSGMPSEVSFDNRYTSIDLLHAFKGDDYSMYWGIGYTSYRLPVQLDCLTYDNTRQEVWWAGDVYQSDMAFHVYSLLLGIDTLRGSFSGHGAQGFSVLAMSQDRAGGGVSTISDQAKAWVEERNPGLKLLSSTQIAMLVDYDLSLGLQWVGNAGPVRIGAGLGYDLGGQIIMCFSPKGAVTSGYVDASPSLYLAHYGPFVRVIASY